MLMMNQEIIWFFVSCLFFIISYSCQALRDNHAADFQQCLIRNTHKKSYVSKDIYTSDNSSYLSVLQSQIKNTRFNTSDTPKPFIIVTPRKDSEVQQVIKCAKQHDLHLRVRGGGHDYEGLSYTSKDKNPFLVLDLVNFKKITVDPKEKTAWVGGGSTLGELYYKISEKSRTLGFPAGTCHSVGVGGHFSGGGYGMMLRKYGLAADHVIDARVVDAKGRILDKKSMGEDMFWAIRGGGGNTFGVVLAWKVQLVDVPEIVTVFNVKRTSEQNVTNLVHKWQKIAPKLPPELFIRIISYGGKKINTPVVAMFNSMYLGPIEKLLPILQQSFPELGVTRQDLTEMSWIESILFIDDFQNGTNPKALQNTIVNNGKPYYFKAKSDYVKKPIPVKGLEGVWDFLKAKPHSGLIILSPYGGIMDEISESTTPYPHRGGYLYQIQHFINWEEEGREASESNIKWIRKLYDYFTPFVTKNPREAYINYRDLDIGENMDNSSYAQAKIWGIKYFKNNFDKLVSVKTKVDPHNFFRNEQSIPPLKK